jgi:F-type H+-transporting ATPase subunit b
MFQLSPGLIVWTLIIFTMLVVVLGKYAWKPLLQALHDREDSIRNGLEQAEKARVEAQELIRQNKQNMVKAEEEYRKMMLEAKAVAEKMRLEIVSNAKQQAQRELEHAKDEIARSLDSARKALRFEAADLAIKVAEKILEESIDSKKHKKLIDTFLDQLPKN